MKNEQIRVEKIETNGVAKAKKGAAKINPYRLTTMISVVVVLGLGGLCVSQFIYYRNYSKNSSNVVSDDSGGVQKEPDDVWDEIKDIWDNPDNDSDEEKTDEDDTVYSNDEFKELRQYDFELSPNFGAQDLAVRNVLAYIENKVKNFVKPRGYYATYAFNEGSVVYLSNDIKTGTYLDRSYSLSGTIGSGSEDDLKASDGVSAVVIGALGELGFARINNDKLDAQAWSGADGGRYINKATGVICAAGAYLYAREASCGHISWIDGSKAELANALAEAYKAGSEEGDYPTMIHAYDDVVNSSYAPYQKITVGITDAEGLSNAAGLFYRVSPDAKWTFFTSTQSGLNCSAYNTQDIRRAFAGDRCYDEAAEKSRTVTP